VLVKTSLIVPGTLSLYLLPRFVSRRGDVAMTKLGVNVTLGITFVGGLVLLGVVTLLGDVVAAFFGAGYEEVAPILPALALAWIPWAMAHGVLTRLTAASSRVGLCVLVAVALVQWFGGRMVLPGIERFIVFLGVLGVVALLSLFVVHIVHTRRDAIPDARGPEVLS
jgi:O-antigen/teichoic acid export membrane protein